MKKTIPYRAWYYFRTGYGNYFLFVFSLTNMFTLTYYLAINENESLLAIFPSFVSYVVILSVIGTPLLCLVGYTHLKRSKAYSSEVDVTVEANPYSYKLTPGIMRECVVPMFLELINLNVKSLQGGKLSQDEITRLESLHKKLRFISDGNILPRSK